MSMKNLDHHNRWRNKTVAFRVSPEEDEQLEIFVKLSGLSWRRRIFEICSKERVDRIPPVGRMVPCGRRLLTALHV